MLIFSHPIPTTLSHTQASSKTDWLANDTKGGSWLYLRVGGSINRHGTPDFTVISVVSPRRDGVNNSPVDRATGSSPPADVTAVVHSFDVAIELRLST